jgi:acrylyl-CoA reductase (NADPH)
MPFILRGVQLLGIDSVMAPLVKRQLAWERLARDLDLTKLEAMIEEITLDQAPEYAAALMAGTVAGRIVVKIQ